MANLIEMNAWTAIGFGANASAIMMALAWALSRRLKNAGYLDVAWAYGFSILVCLYALIGAGDYSRRWLIASVMTIWSLQVGTSLLLEVRRDHPAERPHYVVLRTQFPKRPWLMLFGFSQYRAALLTLLSAPFAIVCSNPTPGMSGWEIAGLLLWISAMVGKNIAKFSRSDSARGDSEEMSETGLERYRRDADSFFDWLAWVAFFVFSLGSPWGWVTVYCPLVMFYLLTKAIGTPPAEAQSLRSPSVEYRN
jgi:steroid 5-alpha reductase family enzyme